MIGVYKTNEKIKKNFILIRICECIKLMRSMEYQSTLNNLNGLETFFKNRLFIALAI